MEANDLRKKLRSLHNEHCASEIVPIEASYHLYDAEKEIVWDAVEKRRADFAAGRMAARTALLGLGIPRQPILRAVDRSPTWPKGIVGSISHAQGFAAAIVTREAHCAGLGLDIEGSTALPIELRKFVLTDAEMKTLYTAPTVAELPFCKLLFVAKEALFKAVFPTKRVFFGFHDAQVNIMPDGVWSAQLKDPGAVLPPELHVSTGRWASTTSMTLATISVVSNRTKP